MPYDVKPAGAGLWMVYNKANEQGLTLHRERKDADEIVKYLNENEKRPSTKEKVLPYKPKSVKEKPHVHNKRKEDRTR